MVHFHQLTHLLFIANVLTNRAAAFSPAATLPLTDSGTSSLGGGDGARGMPSLSLISKARITTTTASSTSLLFRKSSHGRRRRGMKSSTNGRNGSTHLQSTASSSSYDNTNPFPARRERILSELQTLLRVLLPATFSGMAAFLALPTICFRVANFVTRVTDPAKIGMLSDAVGTFISLVGILYSILMGQVFGFLYSQKEVSC